MAEARKISPYGYLSDITSGPIFISVEKPMKLGLHPQRRSIARLIARGRDERIPQASRLHSSPVSNHVRNTAVIATVAVRARLGGWAE